MESRKNGVNDLEREKRGKHGRLRLVQDARMSTTEETEVESQSATDKRVVEHIRKELDRVDRETLEHTLLQWYDQVIIDDEHEQVFLRRKEDGLIFAAPFDELQVLIDNNISRDDSEYAYREVAENHMQKEVSVEKEATLSEAVKLRKQAFVKKALEQIYVSVRILDTGEYEIQRESGPKEVFSEREALSRISELAEVSASRKTSIDTQNVVTALNSAKVSERKRLTELSKINSGGQTRREIPTLTDIVSFPRVDIELPLDQKPTDRWIPVVTDSIGRMNPDVLPHTLDAEYDELNVDIPPGGLPEKELKEPTDDSSSRDTLEARVHVAEKREQQRQEHIVAEARKAIPPIVLKALRQHYTHVQELGDGHIELARKEGDTVFVVNGSDAHKLISLNARREHIGPITKESNIFPEIEQVQQTVVDSDIVSHRLHEDVLLNDTPEAKAYAQEIEEKKKQALIPQKIEKPRLTPEEAKAFLATQKVDTEQSIVLESEVKKVKPHLNNEASLQYLRDVQKMREAQRVQKENESALVSPSDPAVDILLPLDTQVTVEKPVIDIDVSKLETESKKIRIEPTFNFNTSSQLKDMATPVQEAPTRSLDEIKNEIAYLEKIKSEVSYTAKSFIDRYPGLEKIYARGDRDAALHMWVERKIGELKRERRTSELSASSFYDERFQSEFGISKAELSKIEGFSRLSTGQQALIYENLKEYADRGPDGFLDNAWVGIKGAMGNKGERIPSKGSTGMDAYGQVLGMLIYSADKYGPKVHVEDGVLMPDLVGIKPDREHRKEQKEVADALNKAAHSFARVPASWQEDGNGVHAKNEWGVTTFLKEKLFRTENRKQYREYEAKQKAFEEAKRTFAKQLQATGVPNEQIVRSLIEVDAQVHNIRFIETDPEAVAFIQNVKDPGRWKKAGEIIAAGSIYAGIGSVARLATSSVLTSFGAPLVAAVTSGTRSWNKTAAEQRERDRKARAGTIDTSDGALNIVSAQQEASTSEGMKDMGVTAKLERLVAEHRALLEDVNAVERVRFFDRLKARTTYSEDKLRLNRIQFGDKSNFAMNQAKFFETLAQAKILLAEEEQRKKLTGERVGASYKDSRLKRYMDYREGSINDRRHKEQAKRVVIASSLAGAASFAGILATEEYKTGNVSSSIKEWLGWNGDEYEEVETARTEEVGDPVRSAERTTPAPEVIEEQVNVATQNVTEDIEPTLATESAEASSTLEVIETPKHEPVIEVIAGQDSLTETRSDSTKVVEPAPTTESAEVTTEEPTRRGRPVPRVPEMQSAPVEQLVPSLSESVSPSGDVTPQSLLSSESVQQAQSVTPSQESPVEYRQRTPQEIAELKEKQKAIINEWYKDGAREMKALNEVALQSIPRSEVASKFISGLVSNQDWIRMRGVDVHDLLYNKMPPPFVPGQSNPYWPLRNAVTTLSKEFNIKPMPRETLDSFFGRALNQDGVTAGRLAELLKKAR